MYGFEIAHCVAMAAGCGCGGCITWLIGRYKGSVSARTNFASDADSIYHTHHAALSTNRTLIHDWGHMMIECMGFFGSILCWNVETVDIPD